MEVDIVVVGAGAMGTSTAYYASSAGQKVLLLDQHEFGHKLGSSHGMSRIIRRSYRESHFAKLMVVAYQLWKEWEQELGVTLINQTGGLDICRIGSKEFQQIIASCQASQTNYEVLTSAQIGKRFSLWRIPENWVGVYQSNAGILQPDFVLPKIRQLAIDKGCQILPNCEWHGFTVDKDGTLWIQTSQGEIHARQLIVTPGAWLREALTKLGLRLSKQVEVTHMSYAYYKTLSPQESSRSQFPIFIFWLKQVIYGFPSFERPGYLKIAPHYSYQHLQSVISRPNNPDPKVLGEVERFIQTYLPSLVSESTGQETCLYTMTPTENFIIDHHPKYPNIWIGGGFSGHGFKFTPLIGRILADLAIHGQTPHDIQEFRLAKVLAIS